ncbi:MAG: 6-carboxytetrahydropterin synthase [Desulfofustis sp.]|nr:6-carboxytetrahydropterin synthase [Desulfofustis sp.]MBT8345982.1 6-carboxytetrahydropterin synthase [Desulfofustis sp.]NNK57271.1 6-carboxytetrahydropterin synthase [Desulfofustis sp.]RZW22178.1 MAG: 6-carboxytetrahydropterin synthase [Desulfobulbaceae bacterium]
MYRLGVSRSFEARHYLVGGDWGEENVEHSHRYRLELILEADKLDHHGFLVDIVEVERQLEEVVAEFSGKTLNTLACLNNRNPSIEEFATVLHGLFIRRLAPLQLEAITVTLWEDDIAWTSYRAAV